MSTERFGTADEVRAFVQEGYTRIVEGRSEADAVRVHDTGRRLGYSEAELEAVPQEANLGVGCGNPTAIDALRAGEIVVDLGSGAGMDAFLAARQVGPHGRVIGIDMTDAMLEKARANAESVGISNVEFRKGNIEALPIDDASVDVLISNCVINLSPEKDRVYGEAYRVLRPGGRLMVSDIVLERTLPPEVLRNIDAYIGCIGGASLRAEYMATIARAGFTDVRIDRETHFADAINFEDPMIRDMMARMNLSREQVRAYADAVTSLQIFAVK